MQLPLARAALAALGSAVGLLQGYSHVLAMAVDTPPAPAVLGVFATSLAIVALAAALGLAARVSWQRIALRAAGSWIAAIGLMVLALEATAVAPATR